MEKHSQWEEIAPAYAQQLIDNGFDDDRRFRPWFVERLMRHWREGTWEPGTIKLHIVDGREVRVDGQHRLHAVVRLGVSIPFTVERTPNSTLERARAAMKRTDNGLPRSLRDALRLERVEERFGLTQSNAQNVVAAVRFMDSGFGPARGRMIACIDESLLALEAWQSEARAYFALTAGCAWRVTQPFTGTGALAVGLCIMRHCPARATEFYTPLFADSGLVKGQPAKTLLDRLRDEKVSRLPQAWLARAVASAWNAYYRGADLVIIKVQDDKAPIVLLGTPYGPAQRRAA